MNYTKPAATRLGEAEVVIEQPTQKTSAVSEGVYPPPGVGPAYDLDE